MCGRESLSSLELEARENFARTILQGLDDDPDLLVELPEEKRREFLEALLLTAFGVRIQVSSLTGSSLELRISCTVPDGRAPAPSTKPLFEEV